MRLTITERPDCLSVFRKDDRRSLPRRSVPPDPVRAHRWRRSLPRSKYVQAGKGIRVRHRIPQSHGEVRASSRNTVLTKPFAVTPRTSCSRSSAFSPIFSASRRPSRSANSSRSWRHSSGLVPHGLVLAVLPRSSVRMVISRKDVPLARTARFTT